MAVPISKLSQWAVVLSSMKTDDHKIDHSGCIVASPLCAMYYINIASFFPEETTSVDLKHLFARHKILFRQNESSFAGSDFTIFQIITVVQDEQIPRKRSY